MRRDVHLETTSVHHKPRGVPRRRPRTLGFRAVAAVSRDATFTNVHEAVYYGADADAAIEWSAVSRTSTLSFNARMTRQRARESS